jgi:hypothetical protein
MAANYTGLGVVYDTRGKLNKARELWQKTAPLISALPWVPARIPTDTIASNSRARL